jgi:hypothetical protein
MEVIYIIYTHLYVYMYSKTSIYRSHLCRFLTSVFFFEIPDEKDEIMFECISYMHMHICKSYRSENNQWHKEETRSIFRNVVHFTCRISEIMLPYCTGSSKFAFEDERLCKNKSLLSAPLTKDSWISSWALKCWSAEVQALPYVSPSETVCLIEASPAVWMQR